MASSATTRASFTFYLSQTQLPTPPKPKPHLSYPYSPLLPKPLSLSSISRHPKPPRSLDVSQEDKPISQQPISEQAVQEPSFSPETSQDSSTEAESLDKRRLEEKFAVLNTGIYECRSCGFKYDEAAGDPSYPIPPGLPFNRMPEDWRCPTCGAAKSFFQSKSVEIAGFAQNQQFGLGGNTLTSGQKAILIYGGLFLGFLFFLSGYFLQ
nr:Rubredoxin 4 [Ipomoea batatas]